jgi:hypothetical protein
VPVVVVAGLKTAWRSLCARLVEIEGRESFISFRRLSFHLLFLLKCNAGKEDGTSTYGEVENADAM